MCLGAMWPLPQERGIEKNSQNITKIQQKVRRPKHEKHQTYSIYTARYILKEKKKKEF